MFSRFGMFGPRKIWQPCIKGMSQSSHRYTYKTPFIFQNERVGYIKGA
jgi:hypothetical protein